MAALPAGSLHRWYEDLGVRPTRDVLQLGRVDLGTVEIPQGAMIYLCGPLPFMESVRHSLVEQLIPETDIHYEVFGPDKWMASA